MDTVTTTSPARSYHCASCPLHLLVLLIDVFECLAVYSSFVRSVGNLHVTSTSRKCCTFAPSFRLLRYVGISVTASIQSGREIRLILAVLIVTSQMYWQNCVLWTFGPNPRYANPRCDVNTYCRNSLCLVALL